MNDHFFTNVIDAILKGQRFLYFVAFLHLNLLYWRGSKTLLEKKGFLGDNVPFTIFKDCECKNNKQLEWRRS